MPPPAGFNIDDVRRSFPSLSGGQIFLDNAGGSQTLGTVADRIRDYLIHSNVQLGGSYGVGKKSNARYAEGYAAAAKYINASQDEIVLGASTTQLFRNVSYALTFQPGDEIIISSVDHEANIASWIDLAERQNLIVKWWKPEAIATTSKPGSDLRLTPDSLEGFLTDRTRLVTFTHASNILGSIHDVKSISETIHAFNPRILVCVDAVSYAPHRRIDVKELGVDFYSFSWYKVYGPHIALLYASPNGLEQMRSLGHFFNPEKTLQDKIGLAGSSYELVHAIPAVVEYLFPEGGPSKWEGIIQQEKELQETLIDYLTSRDDVTIWGESSTDPRLRVSTISFTVDGWDSKELVEAAEKKANVGFRFGHFYSNRLTKEILGLDSNGVVRVSMLHYNTVDEVKTLISALDKTLAKKS